MRGRVNGFFMENRMSADASSLRTGDEQRVYGFKVPGPELSASVLF